MGLREIRSDFKELQEIEDFNDKEKTVSLLNLWNRLAGMCDVFEGYFEKPNCIPVRELQFLPSIKKINLSRMGLDDNDIETVMALSSLKKLEWLNLSYNRFTEIPSFCRFEALRKVNMNGCPAEKVAQEITEDTNDDIGRCRSLEYFVHGYSSDVKSIDMKLFKVFPNLKEVSFWGAGITDISMFKDEFFTDHPEIVSIDLEHCPIATFPKDISEENKKKLLCVSWTN